MEVSLVSIEKELLVWPPTQWKEEDQMARSSALKRAADGRGHRNRKIINE